MWNLVTIQGNASWLESFLPSWLLQDFIGMEYWRWATLVIVISLGFAVDLTVRFFIRRLILAITNPQNQDDSLLAIIKRVPRPAGAAAAGGIWLLFIAIAADVQILPKQFLVILQPAVSVYITLACIWFGFRGTDLLTWVAQKKASQSDNKLDDLLVPLLGKTLKAIVIVFGIVYLADSLSIQLTPIIAGLGIGGLGFAFAAKDTLENFFGSITVILDKPFTIGDWVEVDGVEGTVESVGMRSTRIRTFYDSLITIPNSILITTKCDNFARRRYRRWKQIVGVAYNTSPEKIATFCEGIRELLRDHPYTRKDYYQVWLNDFGGSSLNILIYVFWSAPDWQTELRERHRLILDIIRLAGDLQVEFAFPTRTLYLRKEDGWESGPGRIDANRADGWTETAEQEGRELVQGFTENDEWREAIPPPYRFTGGAIDGGDGGDGGEG